MHATLIVNTKQAVCKINLDPQEKETQSTSMMTGSFELLVATRNQGKLREVERLLSGLSLRTLLDFPEVGEVEETGATFEENASLKASAYAAQTGLWTLADDSGLEVLALDGAPGVLSARYAGASATDAERNALLLSRLSSIADADRRARFVSVIAIANAEGKVLHLSQGTCEGRLAQEPRGQNGFGYDPLFIPDGYTQTFGELPEEVKEKISHRARALAKARPFLLELWRSST